MSEDDLFSIDHVVKICAARGSPPEVRKEDIVFFEDPSTKETRDPVPINHRHNGGTDNGRCLEGVGETGDIDRITDGFFEETKNDKFVKETRSEGYVKDNSNSNFSKHVSNSRDVEESRQDELVEETPSDKYVDEEDTVGNLPKHTRTVYDEDTIDGNFAKHFRSVKYVEDSEEAVPIKKVESTKGATVTKMGQCKTSAFEKTGSPDSVIAYNGACGTSDSWGQDRFENLHPIARMRYRRQMAD
jgi:hypothetical protein